MNRDSSFSTATGYSLDNWGTIPIRPRNFRLLREIQHGSGTHSASYPVDIGVKAVGAWIWSLSST